MAEGNLAVLPQFSPPGRVATGLMVPNGPFGGLVAQKGAFWQHKHDFVHLHGIRNYFRPVWYEKLSKNMNLIALRCAGVS